MLSSVNSSALRSAVQRPSPLPAPTSPLLGLLRKLDSEPNTPPTMTRTASGIGFPANASSMIPTKPVMPATDRLKTMVIHRYGFLGCMVQALFGRAGPERAGPTIGAVPSEALPKRHGGNCYRP